MPGFDFFELGRSGSFREQEKHDRECGNCSRGAQEEYETIARRFTRQTDLFIYMGIVGPGLGVAFHQDGQGGGIGSALLSRKRQLHAAFRA
jgi:hypothetical protein